MIKRIKVIKSIKNLDLWLTKGINQINLKEHRYHLKKDGC